MFGRILAVIGGLSGAAGLSQYPEFAQQYTQNLSGQVQALGVVVADFDASAARAGLSREAALAELTGSAFLDDRGADMARAIARHEGLSADLAMLSDASGVERLLMPHRLGDGETFRGTWAAYEPAMPLTLPGAISTGSGYLAGWGAVGGLLWLISWPFRRRRRRAEGA